MKNIIAAIVSFIVLSALMYLCTYWHDAVDGEGRKLIIFWWCVMMGIGSMYLPMFFIIEKPLKD